MGWVEKKENGKYRARYRNADGKVRSAGVFVQKKQAEREAERVEAEQRQPGALNLDGGKIRWGAWFDQWHDSRVVAFSTDTNYTSTAENHIRPYWGETPLDEIEPLAVNRWVKQLQRNGASPYTIRNAVTLFKTTLKAAVDGNRLGRNPAQKVNTPELPQAVERFLTRDEVDAITFYMNGANALIVWTSVLTGLRFGELAGLHWSRVDLERGVIQVVEKYDQKANVIDPLPKDKEQRTVPLPDELVEMLTRYRDRMYPHAQATCKLKHGAGRCTSDLVFRGPRGAALKSNEWGRGPWRAAKDLAGVTDRVRPHDMRHTYASWLIQQGVDLPQIARVMGHSDTEVSRRYAHLDHNAGDDRVRDALSAKTRKRATPNLAHGVQHGLPLPSQGGAERGANEGYTRLRVVRDDDDENAG